MTNFKIKLISYVCSFLIFIIFFYFIYQEGQAKIAATTTQPQAQPQTTIPLNEIEQVNNLVEQRRARLLELEKQAQADREKALINQQFSNQKNSFQKSPATQQTTTPKPQSTTPFYTQPQVQPKTVAPTPKTTVS